ncbi:MAG: chemotaxis protein CheW [Planctomycetota bacterium]
MSGDELEARRVALRAAFDASFAAPRAAPPVGRVELLALRCGGEPFALRRAEVAAVERGLSVVPPPGGPPGLRGLAARRGRLLAVWDLAALVTRAERGPADGAEPQGAHGAPWLLVSAREPGLAFACAAFEGLHAVEPSQLRACIPPSPSSREVWDEGHGAPRPVLEGEALLDLVRRRAGSQRRSHGPDLDHR